MTKSRTNSKPARTPRVRIALPRKNVTANPPKPAGLAARLPSELKSFVCALDDPFCTESFGAKVPDEYALPSEASTLRHRFSLSSITAGDYVVCTPVPALGSIVLPSSTAGAPVTSAVTGLVNTLQVDSAATKILTVPCATPVSVSNLASVYSSYRVVGWGVRIKNLSKPTDVFGDFTAGVLPVGGFVPSEFTALLDRSGVGTVKVSAPGGGGWIELQKFASLPTNSFYSTPATDNQRYGVPQVSSLEGLASFDNFTAQEVAEAGGVLIKPKLHAPGDAWKFRATTTNVAGGGLNAGPAQVQLAATQGAETSSGVANFDPSALDAFGHNVVVIQFGPSAGQTYEIEVVYHIEAIPVIGNSSTAYNPVGTRASPVVPRYQLDNVVTAILKSPWVEYVKHEGSKLYGNAVQALPGLMSKAMMSALA